jgi:transposase
MERITNETRKKVVREHIQDGRTLESLAAEYGVAKATVSNWVHAYREECQTNDTEKSQLELMEEVRRLRQEKAKLEKENLFLKKAAAFFAKGID